MEYAGEVRKIHLIGDSYFEKHLYRQYVSHKTFYDMLCDKYDESNINNTALSGSGPHRNLTLFLQMIQNEQILSGDVVCVHVSGTSRVQFPYYEDTINEYHWDHEKKKSFCYEEDRQDLGPRQRTALTYYNQFRSEIDFAYLTFNDFLSQSDVYFSSVLYSFSRILDIKILVFDKFQNDYANNFMSLNDNKYHYYKKDLFSTSTREVYFDQVDSIVHTLKEDKRINHLSEENHKVMFNLIDKFANGAPFTELNGIEFMENFRNANEVYNILSENHPYKEKFVYD